MEINRILAILAITAYPMRVFLKKQVVIGFLAALVVLSALGFYGYHSIQRLINAIQLLTQASRIINNAERLLVLTIDIETGVRGYVITGDSSYLAPYENSRPLIQGYIDELLSATQNNPTQHDRVVQLDSLIHQKGRHAESVVRTRSLNAEEARALVAGGKGKAKMDEIRSLIMDLQTTERTSFRNQNTVTGQSLTQFQVTFVALLAIPAVLIVILFYRINRQLTARVRAEEDLRRASEEIAELNKELEGYTYSVSHDLRAPLRSISGYSQVIKEDYSDRLDDEGRRVIDVIIRNTLRMSQLIDDLLNFSRIGRKELVPGSCNMDELARSTLHELLADDAERKLDVQIAALDPVHADVSMMRQVWTNLLSNALKYSSTRPETRIEVGSYHEGNMICYYVKDNGVGFNMAYKDKLFGVFQRLHKVSEFEGTGVGLALVKRIVAKHGGRIWAEGQPDVGATFYFSLPA